ncbi:AMIN domain-containing protein [Phormidium pseudopriestleyi FRX01]|uniref:AMIN domain-containing protein n=1 Tax=Phormidium pseudopriestleyi FRX01 TaxID=1759528 RepID=A0ABS3FX86_9CYAN|nr:AMIN domain-containing protein [Phormidium pseudopriestleyi]MBO0351757.1 AMIN domain-containing protein [Phormidium pseudopriestleyi FRX01]
MPKARLARRFSLILLATTFCSSMPKAGWAIASEPLSTTPMQAIASAPELRIWEFDPYTNELQITVPEGITPDYSILTEPLRIVIDIPNGDNPVQSNAENYQGTVREIRIAQMESGVTRIVMEFAPGVTLDSNAVTVTPIGQSNRWVVRPAVQLSDSLPTTATEPNADLRTLPMLPPSAANQPPAISWPSPTLESAELNPNPEQAQMPILNVPPPPPQLSELNITVEDARSLELTEDLDFELPVETTTATNRTPTVTVPPVDSPSVQEAIAQNTPTPVNVVNVEPEISPPPPPPVIETPTALNPGTDGILAFGQPLPTTGAIARGPAPVTAETPPSIPEEVAANIPSDVLLSSGTVLVLSYPGSVAIALEDRLPRQEVLLVYSDIYDRTGQLIAPVGTPVIGSFQRDRGKIRFQTQSIVLKGRAIPFLAESEPIDSNRDISERRTISYSAVGAVAGAVLGGLAGGPLLGGAAAGALTSLLRSDIAAIVEPGQILPVRLSEHWR